MRYVRVDAGEDDLLDDVWSVKEAIRRDEGFLRQTWEFFSRSYTENDCHLVLDDGGDGTTVAGFATVRDDGYVLFLGVREGYRGEGLGRELLERIDGEHGALSCHTRAGNDDALGFYRHLGFETKSLIENYYQDGDDAYYLVKGEDAAPGLGERIANALRSDGG